MLSGPTPPSNRTEFSVSADVLDLCDLLHSLVEFLTVIVHIVVLMAVKQVGQANDFSMYKCYNLTFCSHL